MMKRKYTAGVLCLMLFLARMPSANSQEKEFSEVVQNIEKQFKKQGIEFDVAVNREQILKEFEQLFSYFSNEHDPGASKRLTYLLSLFQYAKFERISGGQLRQLVDDIGQVLADGKMKGEVGKEAEVTKNVFDMNQILAVTDYLEMEKEGESFTLVLHTNCTHGDERRLTLNSFALPESAKRKLNQYHIQLSHIEYEPVVRLQVVTRSEIRRQAHILRELIFKKSIKSVHEMLPKAPEKLDPQYTLRAQVEDDHGNKVIGRVVDIESRTEDYLRRVESGNNLDFLPFLMNIRGIALKAKWSNGLKRILFDSWRKVHIQTYAIFPQFLSRDNFYSPIVFSALDEVWKSWDFTIKIAR